MPLDENLKNRKWLLERLRAEVVGPDPAGDKVVPPDTGDLPLVSWESHRKPRRQLNGEEILRQDPPGKRYGAGILYPAGIHQEEGQEEGTDAAEDPSLEESPEFDEKQQTEMEKLAKRDLGKADEDEDYDVTLANAFRPAAIGLSFLADLNRLPDSFQVELVSIGRLGTDDVTEQASGIYRKVIEKVADPGKKESSRSLWLRVPCRDESGNLPAVQFNSGQLTGDGVISKRVPLPGVTGIQVVVVSRPWSGESNKRLLTVSLVNTNKTDSKEPDRYSIFQAGLRIRGTEDVSWILPYPEHGTDDHVHADPMADEVVNRLLYREFKTYAIGHGCAADWNQSPPDGTSAVWSDVLPAFETPSTTAELEVEGADGNLEKIRVSMRLLAGLDSADDGRGELEGLVAAYESWIDSLEKGRANAPPVPAALCDTANGLIERCRECLSRIRDGISLLDDDSDKGRAAREAFTLANHAMLIAQLRGGSTERTLGAGGVWSPAIKNPDPAAFDPFRGYWRPFQIAFLLMSLRGIVDPIHADRETVDLIWFPTGGGKTEAYLGLTAFTIFFNRLTGQDPAGVDVLMRYTLRLLTAQQFQRAALLFCAMENLRKNPPATGLGTRRFSLGLWVGGATTPNKRTDALHKLGQLERNGDEENPFVLLRCPWCGARLGPKEANAPKTAPSVTGYYRHGRRGAQQTVVYRCPDKECDFGKNNSPLGPQPDPLPVTVIDEDLIESPPSLLIGTVDKFAMLAWKPELRSFFGIGNDGKHTAPPPSLIIQDELHLISGPLGTMVGAYETVIDRLCHAVDRGNIAPKIIASTATISRAREQIRHLYARDSVMIFPPSGLEAGDSFFARYDRNQNGKLKPGRLYAGIMAPGHVSLQTTQARVYASLLQHAVLMDTDDAGRDPWWTLLCFFNSMRELGGAATLFVADARDYLRVIIDRLGLDYKKIRSPYASELNARVRSDHIPAELARLEIPYNSSTSNGKRAVDACLASSIIEVGVDVPRISLMAIVGQPKTTSQYIQVSSRVGRDPEKPGLVTTLYGQSKPRDRSHYERFRSYHQQIYAQVEPTSVTPFSLPAVDRALHGLIVAAVLQLGDRQTDSTSPRPFPLAKGSELRELIETMIEQRVEFVTGGEETSAVMSMLRKRLSEWNAWDPAEYGKFGLPPENPPLTYPAGATPRPGWNHHSWPTLSSLRDVDASCEAYITDKYNEAPEEEAS